MPNRWISVLVIAIFVSQVVFTNAATVGFETPLRVGDLDQAVFASSVADKETDITRGGKSNNPGWVMWTRDDAPDHSGFVFGNVMTTGARHLRVGFTSAIPIASILVLGDVRVSVLKPGAVYPGNMMDDSQWVSAQRIKGERLISEQAATGNYTIWILPSVLMTRAVRFTHEAKIDDASYAGWLGGAYVLAERMANVAPSI